MTPHGKRAGIPILSLLAVVLAGFAVAASSCANKQPPETWASAVAGPEAGNTVPSIPEGLLIVDVRTSEEYAAGHLVGAILLPHEAAAEALARLVPDHNAPIALYCRSGRRSGLVLDELKNLGYDRAVNWGGFEELAKTRAAVRP